MRFLFLGLISVGFFEMSSLYGEVANVKKHSYAQPDKGRENYTQANEAINKFRLYDFYQRQADYYMALPKEKWPELLPAHPGLDAGVYGHWGKYNQNNHKDPRLGTINFGSLLSHVTVGPESVGKVIKGVNVKLDDGMAACFDPDSLSYRAVWKGWLTFSSFRWGVTRGAAIDGDVSYASLGNKKNTEDKYLGVYRHGDRVIFHYRIGGVEILDSPSAVNGTFVRTVEVISEGGEASLPKLTGPKVVYGNLKQYTKNAPLAWADEITTKIELGTNKEGSPYVVDTFKLPFENPYQSMMMLSGVTFDDEDTIYVSTLMGEIWSVKEDATDSTKLSWKRFAAGLHIPFGLHYDDDGLFCLDRGQIYRFHDLNKDGEADYYESFANDFTDEGISHTHTFGLHRTEDGSFYFCQKEQIMRTTNEGVTSEIGYGIRNGMGIGGGKDFFWIGPQEGTLTPASTIIEVEEGSHYGLPKKGAEKKISAPIAYIPRGIDNSTGGFVEITSDRWGPYQGDFIGLSYGYNSQYLILRDSSGPKPQAATIPLPGEFRSGVVRGAFRESDGQLYVAGLDGWGDYSMEDGCLQRVRYTGAPLRQATDFQVFENGLRIEFPEKLDAASVSKVENYLAQTWAYVFSKGYGSPEYSAHSDDIGHDVVGIRSVHLLEDEKSIFVEMPTVEPAMVLYLRMHLKSKSGAAFKTDLFASAMYPDGHYDFDGAAKPIEGKPKEAIVRVLASKGQAKDKRANDKVIEGSREIVINAVSGLKYDQTLITVNRGEAIGLKFVNKDIMPHNLVIVAPGALTKVGEASFKMLNNPRAAELNYTPELKEVKFVVPVIDPSSDTTIYFRVPKKRGDYPFMCTFPGHWQAMQGVLRVQ